MNNKKINLLLQGRRRQSRQSHDVDQFSKFFDTMVFMEEYYRAKFEEENKVISEKEKVAKEKAEKETKLGFFGKKFTFSQLMLGAWLMSLPLSVFWLIVLRPIFG